MKNDDWLMAQLPVGMAQESFFYRFVSIFQDLASSLVDGADNIRNLLDLSVTPDPMVRYLARWIGFSAIDASLPTDVQRRMVQSCADILAWRGTNRGVRTFVELLSGGPAVIEDSGGVYAEAESPRQPETLSVRVAGTGFLPEQDFAVLVRDEVPANVYLELFVDGRRIFPAVAA